MAQNYTTMVGTVGTGIWISNDGGERWSKVRRAFSGIRALAWVPN